MIVFKGATAIDCVLLARGGSKGIPNKNIIDFCGKPLIAWSILQARSCPLVNHVWVSSDSENILEIGAEFGAKTIKRPAQLSGDGATSESGWIHAIDVISKTDGSEPSAILAPQITSPLRSPLDFETAINKFHSEKLDTLMSVTEVRDFFTWRKSQDNLNYIANYDYENRLRRQSLEPSFLENGSFYVFQTKHIMKSQNRLGGNIGVFEMPQYKSFQIDEISDIELCSIIMKGYGLDLLGQ